jgi:hypothetical protein
LSSKSKISDKSSTPGYVAMTKFRYSALAKKSEPGLLDPHRTFVYGAPITESDAKSIADYLGKDYGTEESKQ